MKPINAFITAASVTRILKAKGYRITLVVKAWVLNRYQIGVRYRVGEYTFTTIVSKDAFRVDAMAVREKGAANVGTFKFGSGYGQFFITDSGKVDPATGKLISYDTHYKKCTCPDWQEQSEMGNGYKMPVCKHQIAVAWREGFSSFKEYALSKGVR